MPNPNAIVSNHIRFDPPLDKSAVELMRADRGLHLELDGGRRVRLDSGDPRSAGFVHILDGLSKLRHPVYLELDQTSSAISRLLIPHLSRVVGLHPSSDKGLDVELEASSGLHTLRRGQADYELLEKQLREAQHSHKLLLLIEDDAHRIIEIRNFEPGPDGIPPTCPPFEKFPKPGIPFDIGRWKGWPWNWFGCISKIKAQQVFDAMKATSCNPLTIPPPCIPFLYPDDGCWARAHEMCRLMINMGLLPKKVWIRGSLHVQTKNNPNCSVWWGWHVAPTLCVRGPGFFQTQRMVIDPSLFSSPVTEVTWKGVQGDPNATLTDTDATQYWPSGGTDPNYTDTNIRLAFYRLQLQNRALQYGAPPYANCP